MRYSYIHCYSEIGTHEKPQNPVFYCCYMLLVASLMSICFTGNHRQYALFDYKVKLYFVILYSCVLLEINILLLLSHTLLGMCLLIHVSKMGPSRLYASKFHLLAQYLLVSCGDIVVYRGISHRNGHQMAYASAGNGVLCFFVDASF